MRATLPRLRLDQVLALAWKFLFPLSLLNVVVLAAEVIVWPEPSIRELGIMAGINWAVAIAAVFLASRMMSLRGPVPARSAPETSAGRASAEAG